MCRRGVGSNTRPGRRPFQDCSECTFSFGDLYAHKVDLVLPSGRSYYNTCAGGCVSVLLVLTTLIFLLFHLNELFDENSYVMSKAVAKDWFSETDIFPPK